jgi:hypothetical protein
MRGATGINVSETGRHTNAILPDGTIEGLNLAAGEELIVRDHYLPITIGTAMTLANDSILRLVFADDQWGSVISFGTAVSPSLGGTLVLDLEDEADPNVLSDKTFTLFNWPAALAPDNHFSDVLIDIPGLIFDATDLYSAGQITFMLDPNAPAPTAAVLAASDFDGGSTDLSSDVTGNVPDPVAVPEPAVLSLLAAGAAALLRRRRGQGR